MIPVSLLSAYLYCPRKVFLERVLKLKEPTKESTLFGKIRHAVYDSFISKEKDIISRINKDDTFFSIKKLFEDVLSSALKNAIIINKKSILRLKLEPSDVFNSVFKTFNKDIAFRIKTILDFAKEEKAYGIELWQSLTPKIKSEYRIESEALQLRGIIDQIQVYPERLVPVELKTGKAPKEGMWPGHRIQLAAYIMLLEDKFNLPLDKGKLFYLDTSEERILKLNPFIRDDVTKTRALVENMLSSKTLPPILKTEAKCNACALKDECHNEQDLQKRLDSLV